MPFLRVESMLHGRAVRRAALAHVVRPELTSVCVPAPVIVEQVVVAEKEEVESHPCSRACYIIAYIDDILL